MGGVTQEEYLERVASGIEKLPVTRDDLLAMLNKFASMDVAICEEDPRSFGLRCKTVRAIPQALKDVRVGETVKLVKQGKAGAQQRVHSYALNCGKKFITKTIKRTGELLIKRVA